MRTACSFWCRKWDFFSKGYKGGYKISAMSFFKYCIGSMLIKYKLFNSNNKLLRAINYILKELMYIIKLIFGNILWFAKYGVSILALSSKLFHSLFISLIQRDLIQTNKCFISHNKNYEHYTLKVKREDMHYIIQCWFNFLFIPQNIKGFCCYVESWYTCTLEDDSSTLFRVRYSREIKYTQFLCCHVQTKKLCVILSNIKSYRVHWCS